MMWSCTEISSGWGGADDLRSMSVLFRPLRIAALSEEFRQAPLSRIPAG
jgi:hypothetical protein